MIKRRLRKLFLAVFVIIPGCFLFNTISYALDFSNFYFVGDSLSDIGNNGVYSNGGNIWSKNVASDFGKSLTASKNGGTNYAYGGADSITDKVGMPSARTQITTMIADQGGNLDSNSLYSLWIGGNDFLDIIGGGYTPEQEIALLTQASVNTPNNIVSLLTTMHDAGAKYIVTLNLPYLGETPVAHHNQLLDDISEQFNQHLLSDTNALGFDVIQIDVAGLFADIAANPNHYGFTNTTGMCGAGDCSGYLFWDAVHPTNAGHAVISDLVTHILTAPTYYATLAESPASIAKEQNSVITQQLLLQQDMSDNSDQVEKLHYFMNANYAPSARQDIDEDRTKYNSDDKSLMVGVLYPIRNDMYLGGSLGYTDNTTELNDNVFDYDVRAITASVFANYHLPSFYVNGIANYSYLDYANIKRTVLSTTGDKSESSTHGSQFGLEANGGYYFYPEHAIWKTGPLAKVAYQHISVNGYNEGGNEPAATRLHFGDQSVDSLVGGIGWELMLKMKHLFGSAPASLRLYALGNEQFNNDERTIHFNVLSLAGSHASLPVSIPKNKIYLETGAVLSTMLQNQMKLSLGYNGNYGGNNLSQSMFSLGVSF